MRRKKPSDKIIRNLYLEKKLSLRQIGNKYGVTRQAVHQWIKKLGIKAIHTAKVPVICKKCGKDFGVNRYRWRLRKSFYCSVDCYVEDRNKEYRNNKVGYGQSRRIVKLYFKLKPHHIIHHVDGDSGNYSLENLWVFRNRSAHSIYHHSKRTGNKAPNPIWKGDQLDL